MTTTKKLTASALLVALATVADSMPLVDENRDLVVEGLNVIKNGKACLPLKTLMTVSGMKDITSNALAYSIAPRINAAGRIEDASTALKLLLTEDDEEAAELALMLDSFNAKRQETEAEIIEEAIKK